ncbi:hypothetical protein H4R33_006866 [Dimargaris cristalligena]|nr:hypothetical protein H4R33_006866 [Dimargaris cristalligena]
MTCLRSNKITLCVTSCDQWIGFSFCYGLLHGKARDCIEKIYCGVTDENREWAKILRKEDRVHLFKYSEDHKQDIGKYFKEADAVVLVPVHQHLSQSGEQHVPKLWKCFLECAKDANVRCLTMLSVLNLDKAEGRGLKMVCHMEKMFKEYVESGRHEQLLLHRRRIHAMVLRMALPMDHLYFFQDSIQGESQIPLPIKDQRFAPMAMFDLATGYMCLASKYLKKQGDHHTSDILDVDKHQDWMSEGKAHVICVTGPEKVTGECIAKEAGDALGTKFEFRRISMDELEHYFKEHGQLHEEEIECMLEIFEHINKGHMDEVTKDLEKMLGHKPSTIKQFFQHNEKDFKPQE